jgi:dipeptidase E
VPGIREGNWIRRLDDKIKVEGSEQNKIFEPGKNPHKLDPGSLL